MRNAPSAHPDTSGHGHDGAGRGDLGERPDRSADANGAAGTDSRAGAGTEHGRRTTGVRHLTPTQADSHQLGPTHTDSGRDRARELPQRRRYLTDYRTGRWYATR